jgi:hypothetical protein
MTRRKKPIVRFKDEQARENLPYPYVIYPRHGTFIGFRESEHSDILLCSCYKKAIRNYAALRKIRRGRFIEAPMNYILSSRHFPGELINKLVAGKVSEDVAIDALVFKDKICHRCNLAMPSYRFMDEMYGGLFQQNYGWYIDQKWYEDGIDRIWYNFLQNECPPAIKETMSEVNQLKRQANTIHRQWVESNDPTISKDRKSSSNHPLAVEWRRLWAAQVPLKKLLSDFVENQSRTDFGYKSIGESWISETALFKLVQNIYPDNEVKKHYRPKWLGGLEIDIYLPEFLLGIEYQGQQHYRPLKHWGGEESFNKLVERDKGKKALCKKEGVRLIEFKYDEPLEVEYLKQKLIM